MRKLMIVIKSVIARPRSGRSNLKSGIASSQKTLLAMTTSRFPAMTVILVLTTMLLFMTSGLAQANDVDVYNVSLQNYNGTASPKTVDIKFDLNQQNVFPAGLTDGNGAGYYDRVWIFVKYFNNAWSANTAWKHATLVAGGSVGAFSGGTGFTTDGKGAFCRPGANQTLRWAIGTDEPTTAGTETYKIKVFAIEMVYIPQGAFWVGSGGTESGSFTDGSWTSGATIPFKITSEGDLSIAASAGSLWGTSSSGNNTIGSAGTLPAAFPKGYNAFFIMKYDISQGQYRDFLHTLAYAQQATRTANAPNSAAGTGALITATTYRNALKIKTPGVSGTTPAVYGCDLNGNGTYDEADDSQWVGCNYLSWADLAAYADWAGLRPMTELEFEKAARGRKSATDTAAANVTANEYAWGTGADATLYSDLYHSGQVDEQPSTDAGSTVNTACNINYSSCTPDGPIRCGAFAKSASTTRIQAGASYYGVMELSGNLWKRPVTVADAGRTFTGLHGDGALDASGNADVTNWPSNSTASGSGFRGGSWGDAASSARVSDRSSAAYTYANRYYYYGGRCVRTSP